MNLQPVERKSGLSREQFASQYIEKNKPVVLTDFMDTWAAKEKWTMEYFKEKYGHLEVPVFTSQYGQPGKKYMTADREIPFKEFLEAIEQGPTDLRMFLYNIMKNAPELAKDYQKPTIMDGWVEGFPFMFFGGEGSVVNLHFDIDLSNVFLSQLHGRKRVLLFDHTQSKYIYHQPFTVKSEVNVLNPDYERFPALKHLQGYEVMLEPGETLFMPSGCWHHITYTTSGFSISLRSNDSVITRAKGLINIARHFFVDKGMNQLMGAKWQDYKVNAARRRAEEALSNVG